MRNHFLPFQTFHLSGHSEILIVIKIVYGPNLLEWMYSSTSTQSISNTIYFKVYPPKLSLKPCGIHVETPCTFIVLIWIFCLNLNSTTMRFCLLHRIGINFTKKWNGFSFHNWLCFSMIEWSNENSSTIIFIIHE